jgi:hypothetical protein
MSMSKCIDDLKLTFEPDRSEGELTKGSGITSLTASPRGRDASGSLANAKASPTTPPDLSSHR